MLGKFLVQWTVVMAVVTGFFTPLALGAQEEGREGVFQLAQVDMEEGEAIGGDQAEQDKAREQIIKEGTEQILIQTGGVLIPKGTFVLEPAFSYTHFDRRNIAISGFTIYQALVVGTIDVEEVDRDIFSLQLTGRYGITNLGVLRDLLSSQTTTGGHLTLKFKIVRKRLESGLFAHC